MSNLGAVTSSAFVSTAKPSSRTGPELILATKPFSRDSTARSWWYVISTGLLLVAAIAGAVWDSHQVVQVVSSILAGLLILRFFVIYHDQQHHAILPKSVHAEG